MVKVASANVSFRVVKNFSEFGTHISQVLDASSNAELVVLPELLSFELMTAMPSWNDEEAGLTPALETAEFADEYRDLMSAEAKQRKQYILAGSHLVPTANGFLNVAVLYGPEGQVVHEHAKTHLFPLEHGLGIIEGDEMGVVELPFGRVGVVICYEAQIPECSTSLVEQGAELLLCPSLTLTETGFWRVRHCLAARAIENQVYAIHSATAGPARKGWPGSYGRSSILSPCDKGLPNDGVLAESETAVDSVAIADLDFSHLAEIRQSGASTTYFDRRRRSNLYTVWPSHIAR